jgi:hypothetical protein
MIISRLRIPALLLGVALAATSARAEIPGLTGTQFTLTAKADRISTPDGGSIYFWGFAAGAGRAQYPGPTLIVNEGDTINVTVANALPASAGQRVSLSFPGLSGVTAACSADPCVQGTRGIEAENGGSVTYTFLAARPGTFLYNSASRPDLQIEMGLAGALIVRPTGFDHMAAKAYAPAETAYDQEYLFFLSEMDSIIHDMVEQEGVAAVDRSGRLANYVANYWFINGRNAPDTMAEPNIGRLPTQPYNSMPMTHPGDRLLLRLIGGGHDVHPFHPHANHERVIAIDGHLLESGIPGAAPLDLSHEVFTIQSIPGQTVDSIFRWTGKDLGWDIYGDPTDPAYAHDCMPDAEGLDMMTREYCGDHGKKFPVSLPNVMYLTNGGFWTGSPFMGRPGLLPPGQGGLNPDAGFTFMWHSHTEKEMTNFDVFPGGMMTMLIIVPMHVHIH